MTKRYDSLYERLLANSEPVNPDNHNSCWRWTGYIRKGDGVADYPEITVWSKERGRHKALGAHRVMFKLMNRVDNTDWELDWWLPDPAYAQEPQELSLTYDETVDHLCWNRWCINPDHQHLKTRADNTSHMRRRKKMQ